jgi:ABC-type transporter Mla MlaB component
MENVEIVPNASTVQVRFHGHITVESDLSEVRNIEAEAVVLDLADLGRLTSQGVILWMEMMEALAKNVGAVQIRNATHGFLQQYSMIEGFAAGARIESVRATYACEACEAHAAVLFERSRDFPDGHLRPPDGPMCQRCQQPMVADDLLFELGIDLD